MSISLIIPVLIGLGTGFLANYLADVLPATRRFSRPACIHCGHAFPTMDYMLMQKCSQCNKGRSTRTWITLLVMMIVNGFVWLNPPTRSNPAVWLDTAVTYNYFICAIVLTYFAVVFIIDWEHRLILHPTSIFGALLGLVVGYYANKLILTLLGGLVAFVIMLAFYYMGVLFSRYRAKRLQAAGQPTDDEEALGAGDVILSGILGLILGFPLAVYGMFLGILLAGIFGIVLILSMLFAQRYKKDALLVFMPYGPFLVLGAFLWMFILNLK